MVLHIVFAELDLLAASRWHRLVLCLVRLVWRHVKVPSTTFNCSNSQLPPRARSIGFLFFFGSAAPGAVHGPERYLKLLIVAIAYFCGVHVSEYDYGSLPFTYVCSLLVRSVLGACGCAPGWSSCSARPGWGWGQAAGDSFGGVVVSCGYCGRIMALVLVGIRSGESIARGLLG